MSLPATPELVRCSHDAAGNMTTMPLVGALSSALTCSYDAWRRLAKVSEGSTTVAEYEYDPRDIPTGTSPAGSTGGS
jgi:uncharacterized protein RhaS with RHS repeats